MPCILLRFFVMPQWAESQRHMLVIKCVYVCVCVCVCVHCMCVCHYVISHILATTTRYAVRFVCNLKT